MPRQFHLQSGDNRGGDLLLKLKYGSEPAFVLLGPDMASISDVHQLRMDSQHFALPPYAAFQYRCHLQRGADPADVIGVPLELEGTGAGDNLEPGNAREGGYEFIGESIREALIVEVSAEVRERQHHDAAREGGFARVIYWRRWGTRKFGRIGSFRKDHSDGFVRAVRLIILFQLLAQSRELDAHNRIGVGVVAWFAAEDLHSQYGFLQRVLATGKGFGDSMAKKLAQPRRVQECGTLRNSRSVRLDFSLREIGHGSIVLRTGLRICGYSSRPL